MRDVQTHGWIGLSGLRVERASLGVYPEERDHPRLVIVDVSVWAPITAPARVDALKATVDYDALAHLIREVSRSRHINLLETLAESIASAALEQLPITAIRLRVQKPHIGDGATAFVEIERRA